MRFDPVEAVARGVNPDWLVVLTPASLDEGLAMAGALLQGRAVDVLVIDLPSRVPQARVAVGRPRRRADGPRPPPIVSIGSPRSRVAPTRCSSSSSRRACRRAWPGRSANRSGCGSISHVERGSGSAATSSASRPRSSSTATTSGRRGAARTCEIVYAEGGDRDACLAKPALLRDAATAGVHR